MNKIIGSIFGVLMLVSTSLSAFENSAPPMERDAPNTVTRNPEMKPNYEDKMRNKGKRGIWLQDAPPMERDAPNTVTTNPEQPSTSVIEPSFMQQDGRLSQGDEGKRIVHPDY